MSPLCYLPHLYRCLHPCRHALLFQRALHSAFIKSLWCMIITCHAASLTGRAAVVRRCKAEVWQQHAENVGMLQTCSMRAFMHVASMPT